MSESNVVHLASFVPQEQLSNEAQALIAYTVGAPRQKRVTRDTIVEQFNETFQLIGGVPRLAIWADKNPTAFFNLYSKLLPATLKAEMALPQSVENMTPEQIKELSAEQLKTLILIRAAEGAETVELVQEPSLVA